MLCELVIALQLLFHIYLPLFQPVALALDVDDGGLKIYDLNLISSFAEKEGNGRKQKRIKTLINYNEDNKDNAENIIDKVITKRKNFIRKQCRADSLVHKQFIFLDLFKVANYYFYCIMFGSGAIYQELKLDKLLYLHGVNIFFDHVFCDFTEAQYAPTFLTKNAGGIHSFIKYCGEVGQLDKVKDYCKYDLIEYLGQSENCLQFRFSKKYVGLENFEILEGMACSERILERQSFDIDDIDQKKDNVIEQMKKYVHPWQKHFIGYDTTEIIDEYYLDIASLYVERMFDYGCFTSNAEFGGIPYKIYSQCATLIISFALKHIEYSRLLARKHSEIEFINVLTINRDIAEMVDIFSSVCKISDNEAKQVFDCFTLTYEKYHYHSKNTDYMIMPFVAVSKRQVVFSVVGALSGIYAFLLGELSRKFPKDWSKNISERESQFRKDIFKLFDDDLYIKIDRNLPIQYYGKTLTDIDGCIIEKETNQIVFLQLKWQEQYGDNIRRRQSRMQNFLNETNKWIDDMTEWLKKSDKMKLASMLGLKEKQIDLDKVTLLVVGKHSVHFSGNEKQDDRAEWALWLQLQRVFSEDCTAFRSLKTLFEKLKEDSPYNKLPKQETQFMRMEELSIDIYPYRYIEK